MIQLNRDVIAGLCLIGVTLLALVLANGPLAAAYAGWLHRPLGMLTLQGWINDGLMAIFFLAVGLELKHELVHGLLRDRRQALLPFMAALGGMILPCGIYALLNEGEALRGWAIPAATDIAFALGVLALLGRRVPVALKALLLALAIIDDLGAILIIGLFYTAGLNLFALGAALLLTGLLLLLNRRGITAVWPYLLTGLFLWLAVHESGLHATLAGVIVALAIPAGAGHRLEHRLRPVVAFAILPVFALANAGLVLSLFNLADLAAPVPLGIVLGLVIGKPLGILAGLWLALHLTPAVRPPALTARHLLGGAILGGIGFTMSLFITDLSFAGAPVADQARLGVLAGSFIAALLGYLVLRRA